ncbi:(+)-delta-cadinene synthase isozyme XC14 [Triticum urartu]|uniref:(+)-delta-cadinene synthase isozyme XC14 n=1 Tax=Triticum urartu TaxID=4572 RepID=M8A9X2_TRIUA|nr:(+)-delta-cadinene synthase isozyme XC14 [Triticum urartu]
MYMVCYIPWPVRERDRAQWKGLDKMMALSTAGDIAISELQVKQEAMEEMKGSEERLRERVDQLKKVTSELFEFCSDSVVGTMKLVDTLEHLSIDHHFEGHIATALSNIHGAELDSSSLHDVALRFRLLRQHGLWVSPDEFDKFKEADGTFNDEIMSDPRGLLSLYNASYLLIPGEVELESAMLFSRHRLQTMVNGLASPLAEQVRRFLQIPLPRTLKRYEALQYIAEYKMEQAGSPDRAQGIFSIYKLRPHVELCGWGNGLYEEVGLSYARDRIVECYLWSFIVYYEQNYAPARIILAKLVLLASLLDDTYDTYATLEDSQKLNVAIQRWDMGVIPLLPDYLKKYYARVMDTFKEIEDELKQDDKYRMTYCRKGFQTLSSYYLQEAEWFHRNYMPRFQEQVNVSVITSGSTTLSVGLLVGMGDEANNEAFEWAIGCTDVVMACSKVTRFMDDLAAFKRGKNKMDVPSSLECYINEHNVTSEVAITVLDGLVEDAWKTINRERFVCPTLLPFVNRVINLTTSMSVLFHDGGDGYTYNKDSEGMIEKLFAKPIPL